MPAPTSTRDRHDRRPRWLLSPPSADQVCSCAGCQRTETCYSTVQSYRQAITSPDEPTRFAARALSTVSKATEATGGAWLPVDRRGHTTGVITYRDSQWLVSPGQARRIYLDHFSRIDPFSPANSLTADRAVVTTADLGGHDQFALTHFAVGFLERVGFTFPAVMNLRHSGRLVAQLFVGRSKDAGDFNHRDLALLHSMQSFIEASFSLGAQVDAAQREEHEYVTSNALSARELEVARLVANGATNREAAETLMLSVATIKSHLHRVFVKLDIRTRTELTRIFLAKAA